MNHLVVCAGDEEALCLRPRPSKTPRGVRLKTAPIHVCDFLAEIDRYVRGQGAKGLKAVKAYKATICPDCLRELRWAGQK